MEGPVSDSARNPTHAHGANGRAALAQDGAHEANGSTAVVAHTLTACTRCRTRKTRCDANLPKCGPCEKARSVCEYFDANKGHVVNRNYVVYLQHKVRELEEELEKVENEDVADDPEAMMRAAVVRMQDARESKFLGPASGIAITRLVMQLAKQFTDSKSIREIVPDVRARQIKDLYRQEQGKPTSKIYPITSNVAAPDLPPVHLTVLLANVYKLKVQPMYPALHEPTLDADIKLVYEQPLCASPFQHLVTRMVIAISLQKMDTQYAGLADSFYLAALKHLEPCIRPMDIESLQCFALMAEYSTLTPTRTAIYYVVGIAVRLLQSLGFHEEKTITISRTGEPHANALEVDMRRRLFWCIWVMELGLAHSLGRPSILATSQDHIDVEWFDTCDDKHITRNGRDPAAQPTLKKWVAIHFFKMRLLQLEVRRTLYLKKRPSPKADTDPWFVQMSAKMLAWRDATPDTGENVDKRWFTVRYNTMVVFLYRPSPQISRPTLDAALKCFEACEFNIYIQRDQILNKSVDLTWIFAQSIFMAINTILWSLSYVEVRKLHSRTKVEQHLEAAMQGITYASERWPGVASAVQLYHNLIHAVLKVYEKDGDVPISTATPSDAASPPGLYPNPDANSHSTSPATASSNSVPTPPEPGPTPFGNLNQRTRRSVEQPPPVPYQSNASPLVPQPHLQAAPGAEAYPYPQINYGQAGPSNVFNVQNQWSSLPDFTPDFIIPGWNQNFHAHQQQPYDNHNHYATYADGSSAPQPQHNQQPYDAYNDPVFDPNNAAYPFPMAFDGGNAPLPDQQYMQQLWDLDGNAFNHGLTEAQQQELMQTLQTDGMEDIQHMITSTMANIAAMTPKDGQEF